MTQTTTQEALHGSPLREDGATTSLVVDLASVGPPDLSAVGGKAANLGALLSAGFAVPKGFCVTTRAYRLAVAGIAAAAGFLGDAGAARTAVLGAPIPKEVEAAVRAAYATLGEAVAVAVRSSATAEDLPGASFAGQQDSYLNVVGPDAVVDAVRRCWASLWTDRAVAYRAAQGVDGRGVALAVVVQEMVDVGVAGVLFTANPVTGRRREAVIDASPGLGEAVVSGAVDPDHFVVDTASGQVSERRQGSKQLTVRATAGGGTERVAGSFDELCLDDRQVRQLARLGDRVEQLFGMPQDIEWALAVDGQLWLTQSRPITTLYPIPQPFPGHSPTDPPSYSQPRVLLCVSLAQGLHRPMTPLGLSAFALFASSAMGFAGRPQPDPLAGPRGLRTAGDRLFVDATPALQTRFGRALVPRVLDVMEARSAVVIRGLLDDPRFATSARPPRRRLRRPRLAPVLRLAVRYRLPIGVLTAVVNPTSARRRASSVAAELGRRPLADPEAEPIAVLDSALHLLTDAVGYLPRLLPAPAAGFALFGIAARLLRGLTSTGEVGAVLRSVEHNVTTEMDLELWQLASLIRDDDASAALLQSTPAAELAQRYRTDALPNAAQDGMRVFLQQYGHRAVAEIDLGVPRWSDDPAPLFGVLAGYLRLPADATTPAEHFTAGATEADALIDDLAERALRRSRGRGLLVRFCLRRARHLVGLRELPKFTIIATLARVRASLLDISRTLVAQQQLSRVDDLSMVTLPEIRTALRDGTDLRKLVAERDAEYTGEMRRRYVPRLLVSDGTDAEVLVAGTGGSAEGALTGTPASAGTVTAVARVVLDPADAQLLPGEILVAPSTDPGWTPLFLTAGGLVMEMGGANSHGAVVAREYGIPAVVGVADATHRISTGATVVVDGSNGTVSVAPPADADEGQVSAGGAQKAAVAAVAEPAEPAPAAKVRPGRTPR